MLPFLKKIFGLGTSDESISSNEIEHINQEVYKKSVELSERNKTLLILRKIDEIILSTITDQTEIARKVTHVLVNETNFEFCLVYKLDNDKKILKRLALYETNELYEIIVKNSAGNLIPLEITLRNTDNSLTQSILEKRSSSSNTLYNSVFATENITFVKQIENQSGIKSVLCYPFIVRDIPIGIIVFGSKESEADISEYTSDLLERVGQVVGIAIDNAELYNNLEIANEKLKVLDKLKDEFVSLASHELRTPMTAIKSYLWMLLKNEAGQLNEKQNMYLQRAYNSTDRLIKLVNDMLNISRIESGRISIELKSVDLQFLVREVVSEFNPRLTELGINLIVNYTKDIPNVLADAEKIKEVLYNLIGNSVKFTKKGGKITISFIQKNGMIETCVSDTGSGISPENISKLFKKFSMLNDSYKDNKNAAGSGLGLYISYSIIDLHNGRMWAHSEGIDKGTQFYFSLKIFDNNEMTKLNAQSASSKDNKVDIIHTQI